MPHTPPPNLHHDVDALFRHMRDNLHDDLTEPKDWSFTVTSPDLDLLNRIAEEHTGEDFEAELIEDVTIVSEDGTSRPGSPILSFIFQGVLKPADVKELYERFKEIAADNGVTYEGVSCADPVDAEAMFGWLELDDALWRLRTFSDSGLEEGDPLGFVFAVGAEDARHAQAVARAFAAAGFDVDGIDVEDDDEFTESPIVLVHMDGTNDDDALTSAYGKVQQTAAAADAEFLGVQFENLEGDDEDEVDE